MKNSKKLEALMMEKELKTFDEVRDYLRENLTSGFITKQIFNILNTTDKQWESDVDVIKEQAVNDVDFGKYCGENYVEAAGTWKSAYFSYCCLEYMGRRVLRHLTAETLDILKTQNITMDFELLDKLHDGIQPRHLGITNNADLETIAINFLNYHVFFPLDASQGCIKDAYDTSAYVWYTMTKGLSTQSLQYLKMRRLMSEDKIAKALNLDPKRWDFIRIRRHVRKDMVKAGTVDKFKYNAFLCKNEKGNDVPALELTKTTNDVSARADKVLSVVRYTPNGRVVIEKAASELHIIGNKCVSAQAFVAGVYQVLKDKRVTDLQSFIEISELPEFIAEPLFEKIADVASKEFGIR